MIGIWVKPPLENRQPDLHSIMLTLSSLGVEIIEYFKEEPPSLIVVARNKVEEGVIGGVLFQNHIDWEPYKLPD